MILNVGLAERNDVMALVKCKECGKEVSKKASACPNCGAPVKKASSVSPGCGCALVLLVGAIIVGAIVSQTDTGTPSGSRSAPSKPKESPSTVDLNATVSFNGTQFIIANGDSFDWTNVKLEINSKTFSSGYTLKTSVMKAGEVYTVGAMQFAKSDGEKFNPYTHKVLNLSVWCDTTKGKGFYYGTWR